MVLKHWRLRKKGYRRYDVNEGFVVAKLKEKEGGLKGKISYFLFFERAILEETVRSQWMRKL